MDINDQKQAIPLFETLNCPDFIGIYKDIAYSIMYDKIQPHILTSYFKYVFKAVTGQTFSDYIRQKKIEKACELLTQSNFSVVEIAYRLGYKNAGSFSVQFKEYTGVLPSDYRILEIDW